MNADGVARFRASPERTGIIFANNEEGFFKVVGNAHVALSVTRQVEEVAGRLVRESTGPFASSVRELDQTQTLMGQVQFFDTNLSAFGVEIRRLEFDWHCFLQLPTDH